MRSVLITTDFSTTSAHALDYACHLLRDKEVTIDLVHIFEIPVNYSADGAVLAAVSNAIDLAEVQMEDEVARIRAGYPHLPIEARIVTGGFLETLRSEVALLKPVFMILGTSGFTDIYPGDADPLEALRSIRVPVLFVPEQAEIKDIESVAYACNYAFADDHTPFAEIKEWISLTGTPRLHIVHSEAAKQGSREQQEKGEHRIKKELQSLRPVLRRIQDEDVIQGLTHFITGNNIDCLLVVPRRHGLIESLFHRSRTKALARLNRVPIIAFHEKD